MSTHALVPHRNDQGVAAGVVVSARAELLGGAVRFEYRLTGSLGGLAIPRRAQPRRADRLWEHTCFEAFVAPHGGARYVELNFSPSTEWAAYAFDAYRDGMRPLEVVPLASARVEAAGELTVTADVERAAFGRAPWPWRVGLTAVVEDRAGGRAYHALRHVGDKPDFHDAAGFLAILDGSDG